MTADESPKAGLHIHGEGSGAEVPTFSCIAYVSRNPSGGVSARTANLEGIECTGATEREALGKLVEVFKEEVRYHHQAGHEVPWIDPPVDMEPDEQRRIIPVHL